jgi:hypothetical protein
VTLLAAGIASSTLIVLRRASEPPAPVVATSAPTPVGTVEARVPEAIPTRARPAVVVAVARSREPEVLVPPDEGIALRKLLVAVREGRAIVPAQGSRPAEDADGHMLEPTPIDIPSIKIELLPGTPVAGSGGRLK